MEPHNLSPDYKQLTACLCRDLKSYMFDLYSKLVFEKFTVKVWVVFRNEIKST